MNNQIINSMNNNDNIKVLFVDDEIDLLNSLKSMLYSVRKKWSLFFAENGQSALEILQNNPIDIIVCDMRMPGMDGAELLDQVMELYPHVIRIILSGHSDKNMIMKATLSTHRFLAKPCDADDLKSTIIKAYLLRKNLHNQSLVKIINGIDKLPSIPDLYIKLEEEIKKEDINVNKIAALISDDMAVSAKLLQFVNSGFFSLPAKMNSIVQTVNFLGVNIIKSLVLYTKVFSSVKFPSSYTSVLNELQRHSLIVAKLAKEIMFRETNNKNESEKAYLCGILHDIGKLVMLKVQNYYESIISVCGINNPGLFNREIELFGVSHAQVGAYLMNLWGLSEDICEVVNFHIYPSMTESEKFSVLTAVHLADVLTRAPYIDFVHLQKTACLDKLPETMIYVQNFKKELE